jgi:hypothetical protein
MAVFTLANHSIVGIGLWRGGGLRRLRADHPAI